LTIKKNIFRTNLEGILLDKGITQADLARLMNVTSQHIWPWASGKSYPNTKNLAKIASALGISVEKLTNGNKPEELSPSTENLIRKLVDEQFAFKEREWEIRERELAMHLSPSRQRTEKINLEFPSKPEGLTAEKSFLWNMNELALHRWEKTDWAFNIPTWALEKFCLEAKGPYEDGKLQEVTGILKDFIKAGERQKA